MPVEDLANRVGLGASVNLRQHLRRAAGLTPGRYRDRFNPNL